MAQKEQTAQKVQPESGAPPPSTAELVARLRGKWQIPLLALGAACFVLAIVFVVQRFQSRDLPPEAILQQAEAALAAKDYPEADKRCDEFLRLYPRHEELRRINEIQGDANFALAAASDDSALDLFKKAATAYRAAGDVRPGALPSPSILVKLGLTHLRMGEPLNAINYYDQALRSVPQDPLAVHKAKIEALRSIEPKPDLNGALAEVATVRAQLKNLSAEQQADVALLEAEILNERGEHVKAEQKLRALLEAEPRSARSKKFLMALARTQQLAGRPTQALDTLYRVLSEPLSPEALVADQKELRGQALVIMGRVYFTMSNYDKALETYERAAREYPGTDEALAARLGTAETYLMLGELRSASQIYGEIAKDLRKLRPGQDSLVDPNSARQLLKVQSETSALRRRYDEAFQYVVLEQSIMRKPDRDVLYRRAAIRSRLAEGAAAEAGNPALSEDVRRQKRLEAEQGWREAADLFVDIAETFDGLTQKEYPEDLWQASRCAILAGATEQAIKILERFVKQQPRDGRALQARLELARQLQVLGKWDKSVAALQDLVDQHGYTLQGFEATYLLGQAYVRKGEAFYNEAEKAFSQILESSDKVDPHSMWYQRSLLELGRLLHRRGKYDGAIIRLNEYLRRYGADPEADTLSAAYLLASALRHQGLEALAASEKETSPARKEALRKIHQEKLPSAAAEFQRLIDLFEQLPAEQMTPLRTQEYQNALFDLADTLRELDRQEEAVKIYNVILYRFQNSPRVMPAYFGLVAIYQECGRRDQLMAVLERAYWTLQKIPEESFRGQAGSPTKQYWEDWIKRLRSS